MQDSPPLFEQAAQLHQQGRLPEAERLCRQLLEAEPRNPRPLHLLGVLCLQQGRNAEALGLFDALLEIQPGNVEAIANLGNALKGLGRPQDALSRFDQALTIRPDFSGALYNRALLLQEQGRAEEALADYDRILASQPDFVAALYNRGILLLDRMRLDKALADFEKAAARLPAFAEAWNRLGMVLEKLERHPEALASYRKAIAAKPDFFAGHLHLGGALRKLGRLDEALVSHDNALALQPDDVEAQYNRAGLLLDMNRFAEALAGYDAVLRRDPFAEVWNNRGHALQKLGQYQEALQSYEKAIAIKPGYSGAMFNRGNVLLQGLKRPAEAVEAFDQALALDPLLIEAWSDRGNALRDLKRHDEALASYERALAIRPDFAVAIKCKRELLFETGHIEDGLAFFRERAGIVYGSAQSPLADGKPAPPYKMRHDQEQHDHQVAVPGGRSEPAGARLAGSAVALSRQQRAISESWQNRKPQIAVIDDLLTPGALQALRRFCLEAPVWRAPYQNGYLGAFPEHGFACPLLGQIAEELSVAFPAIFQSHPLIYLWGFKYDSELRGINIHADEAVVNVNFWITPDEANLDPQSGGLKIWDVAAPRDWDFNAFNATGSGHAIRDFLARNKASAVTIPHRANRAVIFNSDLFHETDTIRFKPGYLNRRINVTMLYGRRE